MIDMRLEKAIKGNIHAYQELILEMKVYLYSVAISFLKDDYDAGDAIENAILISYEKLYQLKNKELFKTWLTRILINECKKILTSKNKAIPIEEYHENIEAPNSNIEQKLDLDSYLNQIDNHQKAIILMYYYDEMSIEEIAEILNIAPGTVKSRLYTARQNLKKIMKLKGEINNE